MDDDTQTLANELIHDIDQQLEDKRREWCHFVTCKDYKESRERMVQINILLDMRLKAMAIEEQSK